MRCDETRNKKKRNQSQKTEKKENDVSIVSTRRFTGVSLLLWFLIPFRFSFRFHLRPILFVFVTWDFFFIFLFCFVFYRYRLGERKRPTLFGSFFFVVEIFLLVFFLGVTILDFGFCSLRNVITAYLVLRICLQRCWRIG